MRSWAGVVQPPNKMSDKPAIRAVNRAGRGTETVKDIGEGFKTGSFDILSAQSNKLALLAQPL